MSHSDQTTKGKHTCLTHKGWEFPARKKTISDYPIWISKFGFSDQQHLEQESGFGLLFFFLEVIPKKLRGREGEGEKANKQGVGNWGSILLGAFSEKLEHVSELVP